jgi:hypothetical protein
VQFVSVQCVVPHARVDRSQLAPAAPQSLHCAPVFPQAAASLPLKQLGVPSEMPQQPLHELALQLASGRPQTCLLSQNSKPPATQSEHRSPETPHARTSEPVRQVPLASQQPVGHVEGPQAATVPESIGVVVPSPKVSGSRLVRPQPGARSITRMPTMKSAGMETGNER